MKNRLYLAFFANGRHGADGFPRFEPALLVCPKTPASGSARESWCFDVAPDGAYGTDDGRPGRRIENRPVRAHALLLVGKLARTVEELRWLLAKVRVPDPDEPDWGPREWVLGCLKVRARSAPCVCASRSGAASF